MQIFLPPDEKVFGSMFRSGIVCFNYSKQLIEKAMYFSQKTAQEPAKQLLFTIYEQFLTTSQKDI